MRRIYETKTLLKPSTLHSKMLLNIYGN